MGIPTTSSTKDFAKTIPPPSFCRLPTLYASFIFRLISGDQISLGIEIKFSFDSYNINGYHNVLI